jgi:hypothetical protein
LRTYTPSRRRTHAVVTLGARLDSSFADGSCLMPMTTTASTTRTSIMAPPTMRYKMASISFRSLCRRCDAWTWPQREPTPRREHASSLGADRGCGRADLCERSMYGTTGAAGWGPHHLGRERPTIADESSDEVRMHGDPSTEVRASPGRRTRCCASQDAPQCQDVVTTRQNPR